MGAILTAALMLEHLGWSEEASRLESAVRWAVENDVTTVDIGGALGTRAVGDAIAAACEADGHGDRPGPCRSDTSFESPRPCGQLNGCGPSPRLPASASSSSPRTRS